MNSSRVGEAFRSERVRRHLTLQGLARAVGYTLKGADGGARQIELLEREGVARPELAERLIAHLGLDRATLAQIADQDEADRNREWEEWAAQPVEPTLTIIHGEHSWSCVEHLVPANMTDETDLLEHAVQVARKHARPVILHLNRRVHVWIDHDGAVTSRQELKFGDRDPRPFLMFRGGLLRVAEVPAVD